MSIVNTTECIICYNEYDTELRKPCIGTCGHSICESCKHQMVSSKCPQCNREEAFAITTINYQVLELIKHFKSMQSGGVAPQAQSTNSLDEGTCSECTLHSKKLRICKTCAVGKGVLKQAEGKKELVLVVGDDGVDEAMTRAKKMAICGDCALDGAQHEGHQTMQLALLKNSIEDQAPTNLGNKISKISELSKQVCDDISDKFAATIKSLQNYFEKHEKLSPPGRKTHFNNIEAEMEKISDTIALVKDAGTRLDFLNNEIEEHDRIVFQTKQPVTKANFVFASQDPVLVADRKQSAREPLLIGVYDPKNRGWTPVGRMPNPKSNYAVACSKSQIYIVGGMNNGSWLNNVEMYDREKNLRRDLLQCNKMKRGRTRTSAGIHNNKMYVAGGYDSTYMNSVEVYDTDQGEWKDGPSLQRPRADAAVVPCNGEVYVLGGFNGKEYEEKIEKLSEPGQKFEIVGDMQGSRAGFGSCAFRGRIYIAGGWSNSSNTLRSVRSYDPLTKSWRDEPSLSKDRKYFTLHSTNEAIYAIRGCADNWSLINEVERFDPEKRAWEIISCSGPMVGAGSSASNEQAIT
ncbi:RING-type domain-containing protein [Caenorhabditis elegans]|uniref:RING-type domain-containing protein n=1 Tax=Caenorhabditis elegans TaxID=6239 RepID=A0A9J5I4G4_CAEEL|nr:RING-type domain-containing protein [Caenorhabditis elegans]CAH8901899.1 RING-type domain-containing protein [Caenorhabditis elegans]